MLLSTGQFTQVLDYYLSQEGKPYLSEINRLAKMNTAEADDKILHYAMEVHHRICSAHVLRLMCCRVSVSTVLRARTKKLLMTAQSVMVVGMSM